MKAGISWSDLHKGYVDGDGAVVDIQTLQPLDVDGVGKVYGDWGVLRALSRLLVDHAVMKAEVEVRNDAIAESALDGIG